MQPSPRAPHIEYMRALAVIAVILHHLDAAPGGFIGVDIFFVISGFVISKALYESNRGSIWQRLAHFYHRRIIRIVPPLLVVTLSSFMFGWLLLFDLELGRLQDAIAQQSLFLQNIYFVETIRDYFQGIPSTQLTLHTWSLAVEEQFYLLFPLFFILLFQLSRLTAGQSGAAVVLITAGLTYLAVFRDEGLNGGTQLLLRQFLDGDIDVNAARFYSITFRSWQFLLGCCAFVLKTRVDATLAGMGLGRYGWVVVYVGLAYLSLAAFRELDSTTWPNSETVAICLVAAICLASANLGPAHRQYSAPARTAVYLGHTSYSLYLWHWPLLGFFAYTNVDFGSSAIDYALFGGVLLALTAATYATVERNRFRISPLYSVVVLLCFVAGTQLLGAVERPETIFSPVKQTILSTAGYDRSACEQDPAMIKGPFVVLFGDSHAQMVRGAFKEAANRYGFNVLCVAGSGARISTARSSTLDDFAPLLTSPDYHGTFIVMRWNMYAVGFFDYEVEETGNRLLRWNGEEPRSSEQAMLHFKLNMAELLRGITAGARPRPLGIMLQVPNLPFFGHKEALIDYHGLRLRELRTKSRALYAEETTPVELALKDITTGVPHVSLLDPGPFLCGPADCPYRHGWNVLYRDDDHLSVYGEQLLAPLFHTWFERMTGAHAAPATSSS